MKSENSFTAFCLISTLLRRVSSARHLVNLDKMKIFAVGMNYLEHNKELHGSLFKPEEPVIFTKADSAVLKDHKPFFIPDHMGRIDYETEIVVRISKLGKNISERFAHRYYDAVTVGIDFTARELQKNCVLRVNLGICVRDLTEVQPWANGFRWTNSVIYRPSIFISTSTAIPFRRDVRAICSIVLTN